MCHVGMKVVSRPEHRKGARMTHVGPPLNPDSFLLISFASLTPNYFWFQRPSGLLS